MENLEEKVVSETPPELIETIIPATPAEDIPSNPDNSKKPYKLIISILIAVLVIGSASAGAYVYLQSDKATEENPTVAETLQEEIEQPLTLTLASPAEGAVIQGEEVLIKGQTLPKTTVVFYTETDQNSVDSDENGQFEGSILLSSGINSLTVTAFANNGEEKSLAMDIINDDQVLGVKTTSNENSGQAKKEEKAPQATIGKVQEVKTNSIVVEEKKFKKKVETTIDRNTKIVDQKNKITKLKPNDLAAVISTDSGVASDGSKLKKALKIYVKDASASAQSKRRAVQGVISSIDGNTIILTHQTQRNRTYQIITDTQTLIKIKDVTDATLSSLKVGQRIAAVGDLNEQGALVVKRIHVIPGKATGLLDKNPLPTSNPSATPSSAVTTTPALTVTPTPEVTQSVTPSVLPTVTPTPTASL